MAAALIARFRSRIPFARFSTAAGAQSGSNARRTVTLCAGDGIGPEVTAAVVQVFAAMKVPIDWDSQAPIPVTSTRASYDRLSPALKESIERNMYCLKGPLETSPLPGYISPDVGLARHYGLFAHVVPVKLAAGIKGTKHTRHEHMDMVLIRENTEGEYSGLEHAVTPDIVLSLKVITERASRRVAEYAFRYAAEHGRRKVTCVHKANIMKEADGTFLRVCRQTASAYAGKIDFEEMIIDNCLMQLVSRPEQFDVLVTGNLYGNIICDAAAGLAGGVGVIPGFNIGPRVRVYEQGARHSGQDIAGKNLANPTSLFRASALMLEHMGFAAYAKRLNDAVDTTLLSASASILTHDLGGQGTCSGFTQAVIDNLDSARE